MTKEQSSQGTSVLATIRPVLALVTICIASGLLLGAVHMVTAPVAERNAQEEAQRIYRQLVPDAADFEDVECSVPDCTAALRALDADGNVLAYVVVTQAKGYGGDLPISVAFDTEGRSTNVIVMANSETPGLGTKVANKTYIGQYVGMPAAPTSIEQINTISGATISSRAVLAAFNVAVRAYEEVHV